MASRLLIRIMGMAVDAETTRVNRLSPIYRVASPGPAIKPIALLKVKQVYAISPATIHVPIIGQGGITTADDAARVFDYRRSTAVGVGTALFSMIL